jgi:hypothetical protein
MNIFLILGFVAYGFVAFHVGRWVASKTVEDLNTQIFEWQDWGVVGLATVMGALAWPALFLVLGLLGVLSVLGKAVTR